MWPEAFASNSKTSFVTGSLFYNPAKICRTFSHKCGSLFFNYLNCFSPVPVFNAFASAQMVFSEKNGKKHQPALTLWN